jgi:ribosomal protein RSM22 (predicted rRNA methylase)
VNFPSHIASAIADWLDSEGRGSRKPGVQNLTKTYAKGGSSVRADVASYLVARAPATGAAVARALHYVREINATLAPTSLLDVGTGPGTATWVARDQFPTIVQSVGLDSNMDFIKAAGAIAAKAELVGAQFSIAELGRTNLSPADLVVASYVLVEFPAEHMRVLIAKLWAATQDTLLLVEPGTPLGFARLKAAREILLKAGAHVIAPCTHAGVCPMPENAWCHFSVRLNRSRAHMHAKSASVPFEDEPFSYLAVSRKPVARQGARLMGTPHVTKIAATLRVCDGNGLNPVTIASRDKPNYKNAKGLDWGDVLRKVE